MATQTNEIQMRLSGGASNSNPATSLGGAMSSHPVPQPGLFDPVSGPEATDGRIENRLVYAFNARNTTLRNARVVVTQNTASSATDIEIGLGVAGMNGTEPAMATEGAVPPNVVYVGGASAAAGMSLGDMPSFQKYPVHIRWKVAPGTAASASDPVTIRLLGDYEEDAPA